MTGYSPDSREALSEQPRLAYAGNSRRPEPLSAAQPPGSNRAAPAPADRLRPVFLEHLLGNSGGFVQPGADGDAPVEHTAFALPGDGGVGPGLEVVWADVGSGLYSVGKT